MGGLIIHWSEVYPQGTSQVLPGPRPFPLKFNQLRRIMAMGPWTISPRVPRRRVFRRVAQKVDTQIFIASGGFRPKAVTQILNVKGWLVP
jgi:hypothetical protein